MIRNITTLILAMTAAVCMAFPADIGGSYWTTARSLYTENAGIHLLDGKVSKYQVSVQQSGMNDVTIQGLMNVASLAGDDLLETFGVNGKYDAQTGTMTIQTPYVEEDGSIDKCARLGTIRYSGDGAEYTVILLAGRLVDSDVELEDELVLEVSEDGETIRPRTSMVAYCVNEDPELNRFLDITVTSSMQLMSEAPRLDSFGSSIDFSRYYVCVGSSPAVDVTMLNACLMPVTYRLVSDNPAVRVNGSQSTIEVGGQESVTVTLTPQIPGELNANVKALNAATGDVLLDLSLNTVVNPAPDYSSIVKEGDFGFEILTNYPWTIDELDGVKTAVSTNVGSGTNSILTTTVDVVDGETALLSWDAGMESKSPNGLIIRLDGMDYDGNTASSNSKYQDMSGAVILEQGHHILEFDNTILLDWYNDFGYTDKPMRSFVRALRFDSKADTPSRIACPVRSVDFGTLYQDVYSTLAAKPMTVYNLGTASLKINGIKGDGMFSGKIEDSEMAPKSEGIVMMTLDADRQGDYSGKVVIETSAGDVEIACHANLVPLPADYTSVVTSGRFSFNTSAAYPFVVRDRMVTSGTAYMPIAEDMDSWLEATFIIGEGQEGTLSWEGRNSSWDYYYFLDEPSFTDGTIITVDGLYSQEYVSESDASSDTYTACPLKFGPGRHTVRFEYQKNSSDIYTEGRDCFMLSSLALDLTGLSVDGIIPDVQRDAVYFTPDGCVLDRPAKGVNIVRRGSSVTKIIK